MAEPSHIRDTSVKGQHHPIVYGPVAEGDRTISGGTYPMPGYGWSCSCGQSGFGYASEDEAGDFATAHSARSESS